MNLSPHFSLAELTFSEAALRHGYDNTPPPFALENLKRLALALEEARTILGVPLHVNSGYRSPAVNVSVGSTAKPSAHEDGRAADFHPMGVTVRAAFDLLRSGLTGWDQLILECNAWIHLAIPAVGVTPRAEALLAFGRPGAWTYQLA